MSYRTDASLVFRYHRDMIAAYGTTHSKALGWMDEQSQLVRFAALAQIADVRGCSILDAGCGYGDLCAYLPNYGTYCGMEQIPELLKEARKRYGKQAGVNFIPGNFMYDKLPAADYVLASGSLNYRSNDPGFIYKAIQRLFATCKLGLGFNLLRHIPGDGTIVAYDPELIYSYCKKLSPKTILTDDYDPDDFTIFIYR